MSYIQSTLGQGAYNVKMFGAKGDGSTDDTPALQAAVNYLMDPARDGGTLFFPEGTYVIASQGIPFTGIGLLLGPNVITGLTSLDLVGVGFNSRIKSVGTAFSRLIGSNNLNSLRFLDLLFENDGAQLGSDFMNLAATQVILERCQFEQMHTAAAGIKLRGLYNRVIESVIHAGLVAEGLITNVNGGALIQSCSFSDGALNGSPAWILAAPDINPRFDSVGTHPVVIDQCGFDEVGGLIAVLGQPVGGVRGATIEITNCDVYENPGAPAFKIVDFNQATVSNCGLEKRQTLDSIVFQNVHVATVENLQRNAVNDGAGSLGQVTIAADSSCGLLRIIDSQYDGLNVQCPCEIESGGQIYSLVQEGSVPVQTGMLLKYDATESNQQMIPALHTDPAEDVMAIAVAGTAFANNSGGVDMPAPGAISNKSVWSIQGDPDVNPLAFFKYQFRNDSQPADPGFILVDISAAILPDDVATAFMNAINGQTGVGNSVAATVVGATITIAATVEGPEYNRIFQLSTDFQGLGQNGLTGGSNTITAGRLQGQLYTVLIDGADAIHVNDPLTLSAGTDGVAAKATAPATIIGRATAGAPFGGVSAQVAFSKETI